MYEIMSSDEAIRLIRDGDCICVNSFVGIESPVELHEALYRRYQRMQSPRHLTVISSAGFGVWDENRNAEGYIREGAVDRLICGHFGAMIGAASVYDMANQFDLYDNGGLDICFMGALEVDAQGNVNAHRGPGAFSGIGGFANITAKTPTVVFCLTFNTKGLDVEQRKGTVIIQQEGAISKFVEKVHSISFSAKRAIANGQKMLYVTERCVFRLTPKGLKLIEVYPGVDMEKDILAQLPFAVEI